MANRKNRYNNRFLQEDPFQSAPKTTKWRLRKQHRRQGRLLGQNSEVEIVANSDGCEEHVDQLYENVSVMRYS